MSRVPWLASLNSPNIWERGSETVRAAPDRQEVPPGSDSTPGPGALSGPETSFGPENPFILAAALSPMGIFRQTKGCCLLEDVLCMALARSFFWVPLSP